MKRRKNMKTLKISLMLMGIFAVSTVSASTRPVTRSASTVSAGGTAKPTIAKPAAAAQGQKKWFFGIF
jgi:hypothetical protein